MAKFLARIVGMQHHELTTELDENAIGIQEIPDRPPLLIEWNEGFLAPGFLAQGIETPTGAIWRPSLWVFGTYRGALAYSESPAGNFAEWAQRLDLFAQVNLTGTERLVVGMRPLDQESGRRREFNG